MPRLPCRSTEPAVRLFADERLHRIETAVARALVLWDAGERDVVLLERVPAPREVLALQARGARCVSLLEDGADTGPHEDPLAFALHDLCHLEKFVDAEHFAGQVGFSRRTLAALDSVAWRAMEAPFDDAWAADRDHVIADMNGSAVFLFSALKMKLKMAVRRRLGSARADGPLDAREQAAYDAALAQMLDAFGFNGALRVAAERVSTRRDDFDAGVAILSAFESDATP